MVSVVRSDNTIARSRRGPVVARTNKSLSKKLIARKLIEDKRLLFNFNDDKKTYNEFVDQILCKTAFVGVTLKIVTLRACI